MSLKNSIFERQFRWQAKYMEPAKRIIGPHLLVDAPLELDMTEATDLMILTAKDLRIGCRVRRRKYMDDPQYMWEFTMRSEVISGGKTEMQKIVDGWGDWLFYGFAEHDEIAQIGRWYLIDLKAWRAHMIRDGLVSDRYRNGRTFKHSKHQNGDGSGFVAFDVRSFLPEPPLLIASSHKLEDENAA